MSVLVLVQMQGKTDRLLEASDRLAEAFGMPDGLTAQVAAPTDEGIVILQLWESEEQRTAANEAPEGRDALLESGILREAVTGTSVVCETDRIKFADVVAAHRPRRKRAPRAKAAASPADPV
ncbi:MAG TPA: hypothetical protein VGL44_05025 [Gaiellales bacterium]|jgi:hypothetical protein